MKSRKVILSSILTVGMLSSNLSTVYAKDLVYKVQLGDTFYKIGQKYNISTQILMSFNNADSKTILYPGQDLIIPEIVGNYAKYSVQKNDTYWTLSQKFGLTLSEFLKYNNANNNSSLQIGQVLKIPVHNVPVKSTPDVQYGELLDWWTEAQYVLPTGSVFQIVDFQTGKSFFAKRTTGSNHADCEPLSLKDSLMMKEIWGGNFSWARRPVIVKFNGRKLAASVSAMPHAGNDAEAGGAYTTWRSDGYGPGKNLDWVKNNGADGVFDLHFLNSTRHMDGKQDSQHQANIKIAAGQK